MDKMKFRMFQWQENPEEFGIYMVCDPEYTVGSSGKYEYTGIGPMCRVYKGKGVFCGADAFEQFNALQVLMATKSAGELIHPLWGTATVYLTKLEMEQESRPDYIRYAFTFQGVDENGGIPKLPTQTVPIG